MILANVAAAEELEARRQPCMYRIHDAPDPAKVAALRDFLDELGIPGLAFAKGQAPRPELFNRLLRRAEATPVAALVNDLVLRCQAQAAYSPDNIGHFGLGLRRYAHFTSPIRRYADLLVHRALIASANAAGSDFGAGALPSRYRPRPVGGRRRAYFDDRAPRRCGRARRNRALSHDPRSPMRSAASSPPALAVSPSLGCSSPWPRPAPLGSCRYRPCRAIITTGARRCRGSSAGAMGGSSGWVMRRRCGLSRPMRSAVACCFGSRMSRTAARRGRAGRRG